MYYNNSYPLLFVNGMGKDSAILSGCYYFMLGAFGLY